MWRKLHVWGGVILALPMLIIGVSTIFIAHGEALGAKQVRFGEMVADQEPKRLVATAQGILLGGKQGVVQLDSNFQVQKHWLPGTDIKALRELGGQLYATAKLGLYQQNGNDWTQLYQGDVEDVALWQNSLVILDKKQGLMQQQGSNWVLLKAYGKTEGPYDLKKLMMDLHSGEAIFGDYDWIWMDILGAYIFDFYYQRDLVVVAALAVSLIGILPALWCLKRISQMLWFLRGERLEQTRLQLRVSRLRRQHGHLLLTLQAANGKALPKARAGQHLQVFYQDAQGKPVSRAYSLAQDCTQQRYYRLAIKAETGGRLSPALYQSLQVGDVLTTSLPKGHFALKRSRKPLVLVAGGVGITPMLAMVYQALRSRRPVTLVYQARTAADLLFHRLLSHLPGLHYMPVLSQPTPDWLGGHGRINAAQLLALGGRRASYYCCANAAMTAQLSADLAKAGVTLHYELFSAGAAAQSCLLQYGEISADSAGFSSVLDALNSVGACIPSDCRGGSCGLCKKRLIQGEVIQMLDPAAPLAAGEVLTCCIQAKTALVLAD